jgi:hypothetical protein
MSLTLVVCGQVAFVGCQGLVEALSVAHCGARLVDPLVVVVANWPVLAVVLLAEARCLGTISLRSYLLLLRSITHH